jgi:predicted DNA-binding transcriptional regulator AlpA
MFERHLSPRELGEIYDIPTATLAQWRHRDAPHGPKFKKFGRLVRYAESDIREWLAQREPQSSKK